MPSIATKKPASMKATEMLDVRALAEDDPHFADLDLEPNDFQAFVTFKICKSFPHIIGPEMNGGYFGFHPQVLAAHHQRLLRMPMNLHHKIKAYGNSAVDRIVGSVLAVSFPDTEHADGWQIPASAEEAPSMRVAAVLWKLSDGMPKLLGEHLSGKKRWSTSIEVMAKHEHLGVFRRSTGEMFGVDDIPAAWKEAVYYDEHGSLQVAPFQNEQLALAMGGQSGEITFQGVAMTPTPAESTAEITSLRASDGHWVQMAACKPNELLPFPWRPGDRVRWDKADLGDAGQGKITEVITSGETKEHGMTFWASLEKPLLRIKPDHKSYQVVRSPRSVSLD